MGKNSNFILALIPLLFFSNTSHAWAPNPGLDLTLSDDCRPEYLEDGMLAKHGDLPGMEKFINEYFSRCEFAFRRRSSSTWWSMVTMSQLDYDFDHRSGIKRIDFLDSKDEMVRPGFLGMQPGDKPRPLVVFQCGVLCNLGDGAMKTIFMGLYDTGVFHVLALPSSTGSDYQKQNGVLVMGGLDEGRQLMRIALSLRSKDSPYSAKISQIHLMGASLGGHSALYASLYADAYEQATNVKPFDSVMVACPVVRLQPAIENITRGSIIGAIFYSNFMSQIREVFSSAPILRSLIPSLDSYDPKYSELRDVIANGAVDYYKSHTQDPTWGLAPLQDARITSIDDLWATNDFVNYAYPKKINPLLLWTAQDDPIVEFKDNSKVLIARDKEAPEQKIYSLVTPRGNHCMYEAAYGWQTAGALFRGYFLSGSQAFINARNRTTLTIDPQRVPYGFIAKVWEKRTEIHWEVDSKTKAITLVSHFLHDDCFPNGHLNNTICNRDSSMPFSYQELGIDDVPQNSSDIIALQRRLDVNYRVYGPDNQYLDQTETPAQIVMLNY